MRDQNGPTRAANTFVPDELLFFTAAAGSHTAGNPHSRGRHVRDGYSGYSDAVEPIKACKWRLVSVWTAVYVETPSCGSTKRRHGDWLSNLGGAALIDLVKEYKPTHATLATVHKGMNGNTVAYCPAFSTRKCLWLYIGGRSVVAWHRPHV